MPPDAITFSDLIGKLDTLRVKCPKCGRTGRYKLPLLIGQYGRTGTVLVSSPSRPTALAASGRATTMLAGRSVPICPACSDLRPTHDA